MATTVDRKLWEDFYSLDSVERDVRNFIFKFRIFSNGLPKGGDGMYGSKRQKDQISLLPLNKFSLSKDEMKTRLRIETNYDNIRSWQNIKLGDKEGYKHPLLSMMSIRTNLDMLSNPTMITSINELIKDENPYIWTNIRFMHYTFSLMESIAIEHKDATISKNVVYDLDIIRELYKDVSPTDIYKIISHNEVNIKNGQIPFAHPIVVNDGIQESHTLLTPLEARNRLNIAVGGCLDLLDSLSNSYGFVITGSLISASMSKSPVECRFPKTKPDDFDGCVEQYQWVNYIRYLYPSFTSYDVINDVCNSVNIPKFKVKPLRFIDDEDKNSIGEVQYKYKLDNNINVTDIDIPLFQDNKQKDISGLIDSLFNKGGYQKTFLSKKENIRRVNIYGRDRPIEVFPIMCSYEKMILRFHLPNIRAYYQSGVFKLSFECFCALKTGINTTYDWMSNDKIETDIILKNCQRGYSTLLNNVESKTLYEHINKVPVLKDEDELLERFNDLYINIDKSDIDPSLHDLYDRVFKTKSVYNIWKKENEVNNTYKFDHMFMEQGKLAKIGLTNNLKFPPIKLNKCSSGNINLNFNIPEPPSKSYNTYVSILEQQYPELNEDNH